MKRLLLIIVITYPFLSMAQTFSGFGVSFSGATANSFNGDVFMVNNGVNRFHLGFGFQRGGQKGKVVDDQAQNYGQTEDGRGVYFFIVDLGFSRVINERVTINPEITIGQDKHYTNYIDRRFSSDRYHLITNKEGIFGAGLKAGYIIKEHFEAFTGFNTIKKIEIGLRIIL